MSSFISLQYAYYTMIILQEWRWYKLFSGKSVFAIGLLCLTLSSCYTVYKPPTNFKTIPRDTTLSGFITNDFQSKIIKGDILSITISSLSANEDAIFNFSGSGGNSSASTLGNGFLVDSAGNITVHKIGAVKAEGLTRKELAKKLETAMLPFMKDPIVNVGYLNRKVTVLGSVKAPTIVAMQAEQMPLLDVLVLSGDLTEEANRKDIMIIREKENTKEIKHLNLEDHSIFSSPWYYVQPNDIVYVPAEINQSKIAEEKRRNQQMTITLVASSVSLLVALVNIFTR